MSNIPRMLTLKAAAGETGLSYEFLRQLCLQQKIVFVRTGVKYLVNMDKLAEYLNGQESEAVNGKP